MPTTFSRTTTPWQDGGARKAPMPASFPSRIIVADVIGPDGVIGQAVLVTVADADPMPGELDWSKVIRWVPMGQVR